MPCIRGPQPRAFGQYQSVRNQAAQQGLSDGQESEASSATPLAPHDSQYRLHPHLHGPWKNCSCRNQSLVPERLGTTAICNIIYRYTHTRTPLEKIIAIF